MKIIFNKFQSIYKDIISLSYKQYKILLMKYFTFSLSYYVSKIWYVFYTGITFQFELFTFQELNNQMQLVCTVLDSTELGLHYLLDLID